MSRNEGEVSLGKDVYIAPTSYVCGDVRIGDQSTIMHHVSIRGDVSPIRIGRRVNIQDGCVVHTDRDQPLTIEDEVGIGHRAVIHCRFIGRGSLIGIGAIILEGCSIGAGSIIAPGAVVTPYTDVEPGSVMMGVPAKFHRKANPQDAERVKHVVEAYVALGRRCAAGDYPNVLGR